MAGAPFLLAYAGLAVALLVLVLVALRTDRAWLRKRGWIVVALLGVGVVIGVASQVDVLHGR